jgi:serine/threonine protein kinase
VSTLDGVLLGGRFLVESTLGQGGMGSVYRAHDTEDGNRDVVVKVLDGELAGDTTTHQRFRREGRILEQLRHPSIVGYIASGVTDGRAWLAMELAHGVTFTKILAQIRDDPDVLPLGLLVLAQIARALEFAHSAGIVHRDLKPDNIQCHRTPEGGVSAQLLDFGIAALADGDQIARLTRTGQVMGTPSYMAPEQVKGAPITDATDVWALGVMLFRVLSGGAKPFTGQLGEMLRAIALESPAAWSPRALESPAALRSLADCCLAREPEDRPSTHEFATAIGDALHPGEATAMSSTADWDDSDLQGTVALEARGVPIAALELIPEVQPLADEPDAPAATAAEAEEHTFVREEDPPPGDRVGPGQVITGKYEVMSVLAEGGNGVVFRARNRDTGGLVAVKCLRKSGPDDEGAKRLRREVQTLARLSHPNTVRVFDCGEVDTTGELFVVMELLHGRTLQRVISADAPFAPDRAIKICRQILSALAEAHSHGVIHRDLKPANIIVLKHGLPSGGDAVKLIDFGIARNLDESTQLTQDGAALGTPAYMAPEQVTTRADSPIGPATDLYAVGILLYEMLTGAPPFGGGSVMSVLYQHVNQPPEPLGNSVAAPLPAGLSDLVGELLAKRPEDRPTSCEAVVSRLDGLLSGHERSELGSPSPAVVHRPVPSSPVAPTRPAPPARWLALGAATLVGLIVLAFVATRSPEPGEPPTAPASTAPETQPLVVQPPPVGGVPPSPRQVAARVAIPTEQAGSQAREAEQREVGRYDRRTPALYSVTAAPAEPRSVVVPRRKKKRPAAKRRVTHRPKHTPTRDTRPKRPKRRTSGDGID